MSANLSTQLRKVRSNGLERLLGMPSRVFLEARLSGAAETPLLVGPLFSEMLASPSFPEAIALPLRVRSSELELRNVRGTPNVERLSEEHFFHARGELVVPATAESADAEHEEGAFEQSFAYDVRTNFTRFEGGNIVHRPKYVVSGPLASLAETVTAVWLCRAVPLRITNLELRIDIFERRSFGALLGFAPLVIAQFSISITEASLAIAVLGRLGSRALESTQEGALLAAACASLTQAHGSDALNSVRGLLEQNDL